MVSARVMEEQDNPRIRMAPVNARKVQDNCCHHLIQISRCADAMQGEPLSNH